MPQIARTDDKKPAVEVRSTSAGDAPSGSVLTGKARDMAHDVEETAANLVEKTAANAIGAVDRLARNMPGREASKLGPVTDLAGFWQDLIKGQIEHNLDAFRKMTAARDWQERVNVQSGYIAGNLARMSEAASRCMQLAGTMAARLPTTRAGLADKAR